MVSVEEMATFCKRKGIVFRTSDIYNGIAGFFDFGPVGVELKNNVKQSLWKEFVQSRDDVVGIDGAIISHPRVWKASGHVASFADLMLVTKKDERFRADQLIEELTGENVEGRSKEDIQKIIDDKKLVSPKTKEPLELVDDFNLMFTTNVGPAVSEDSKAYLRPETAQLIFSDFKLVMESSRKTLPFGIAQVGKAFRNEISPREFLFRSREFEQFEIEYFTNPDKIDDCPHFGSVADMEVNILLSKEKEHSKSTIAKLVKDKVFKTRWHAYWVASFYDYFISHGINPDNIRIREHHKEELAHYASACFDLEYNFPFGWKEIHGDADRGTFDLDSHVKESGQDFSVHDETTKSKKVPYVVAEPSQGIERAMLAFLFDAYVDDKERGNVVLKLHKSLAPIKIGVFPLVNKLNDKAREVFESIRDITTATYDKSGSIGRRYARADELGIPLCLTVDFATLEDSTVTIRDRDTTKQERVSLDDLPRMLKERFY